MAQDVFLQIGDIKGGTTEEAHEDWIRVVEFRHGIESQAAGQAVTGRGATSARAEHRSFEIVKEIDIATPSLAVHTCDGKTFEKATLHLCDSTQLRHVFLEIVFHNVILVGYETWLDRQGGSSDEAVAYERVGWRYARIDWIYTPLGAGGKAGGKVQHSWKVFENKGK